MRRALALVRPEQLGTIRRACFGLRVGRRQRTRRRCCAGEQQGERDCPNSYHRQREKKLGNTAWPEPTGDRWDKFQIT
jgi:hypothetical protein